MAITELKPEQLRRVIDPDSLGFSSTADLAPLEEIVGQERAKESLRVALGIKAPGYNVYVAGYSGSGRATTIQRMLEDADQQESVELTDLAYVHNFQKPDEPALLEFPAGVGKRFKKDLQKAITTLKDTLREEFDKDNESSEFYKRLKEINDKYAPKLDPLETEGKELHKRVARHFLPDSAREHNIGRSRQIIETPEDEASSSILRDMKRLEEVGKLYHNLSKKKHEECVKLRDGTAQSIVEDAFTQFTAEFDSQDVRSLNHETKVRQYIQNIKDDILSDIGNFIRDEEAHAIMTPNGQISIPSPGGDKGGDIKYEVNLFVDRSDTDSGSIVIETEPRFNRLFGSIERRGSPMGFWTDFTKIRAGSIHKAKTLVLDLLAVLKQPFVYEKFMSSLKSGKVTVQSSPYSIFDGDGLKPEPIDIKDLKVILIGSPLLYHMLFQYDPDFRELFRVKADFEHEIRLDDKVVANYAAFVAKLRRDEDLQHFDASGVAAIVEYAMREAGSQKKASLIFQDLAVLAREADYWARQDKDAKLVDGRHVDKAIESKRYRSGMVDEKIADMIKEGKIMIDTTEEVVGQVNGLAVMSLGDYSFGKPSKITAVTSVGTRGITHIEREVKASGPSHSKGVLEIEGYMRKIFAQDKPLSFNASVTFEQLYSGVEGDSASSTELYALLSSLANLPIRQGIAVTGSSMQFGKVQPIGGVNEKIEGYYDTCKNSKEGLTGEQGVMIPYQNIDELMLRKDIVEAVRQGKFHIYHVKTIEEGIEVLTGVPAGTIDQEGTVFYVINERVKQINGYLKSTNGKEDKG